MKKRPLLSSLALAALLASTGTLAQTAAATATASADDAMRGAAQKAISGNPDLTARLNALRASASAVDAARGGLYPRVDVEVAAGRTEDRITTRSPEAQSLPRNSVAL